MNDLQRQNLLKHLDYLMDQPISDEEFNVLDDIRSALKKWDLQGPVPYEAELRARGIDLEALLAEEGESVEESSVVPLPSGAELEQILQQLRIHIIAEAPESDTMRLARKELLAWREAGHLAPLPYAAELATWGIWPPMSEPSPAPLVTPPPAGTPVTTTVPDSGDPDVALRPDYDTARSLIAIQPYQAIQRLQTLQARARGSLAKCLPDDLSEARVELQRRTDDLISKAQRVQQQQPRDLEAQAEAWRAVIALNPESQEAQQALRRLQQRVREAIEEEIQQIGQDADAAARKDHLPDLNTARGRAEALATRADLPADLQESAQVLVKKVHDLLAATRDRLGVASTKKAEGDYREAYRLAREAQEEGKLRLVDTAGVMGPAGSEIGTSDFFREVSSVFLAATRQAVQNRLDQARGTRQSAPDKALDYLEEACRWLMDDVWTPDHRHALRPQLDEVKREIEDVNRLLKDFEEARDKVIKARGVGLAACERLQLLIEAQECYPDYPNIQAYLEEARDNLAAELAGKVKAQIAEVYRLTLQEQFVRAREVLEQARNEALRDVPQPKADSPLALALKDVESEARRVNEVEQALRNLEKLLAQVEAKLVAHDAEKTNLLLLNEARALLDQVPETQRDHPQVQKVRAAVAARQGDRDNYAAGQEAYSRCEWAAACDYFQKITPGSADHGKAERCWKRARAALAAQAARQAEADKKWREALASYAQAISLFDEAGEDQSTKDIAADCREASKRLAENEQRFRAPLEDARQLLEQATKSVPGDQEAVFHRLQPITGFRSVIDTLEPLAKTPSALDDDIRTTLREAREAWRKAYLPALREVVKQDPQHLTEVVLNLAWERAKELKSYNLLYDPEDELLYYRLQGKKLDQEYQQLYGAVGGPDWKAIEENRRTRLDSPGESSEEHQKQWAEAHRKRLEGEIQALREKDGVAAAQKFLGAQVRSGQLRAEEPWLRMWLELCWEARDWAEAEQVVRRLGDSASEPSQRRAYTALWQSLTRAARAYAEDDIKGAKSFLDQARRQLNDPVVDDIEALLEQQTLQRLRDAAQEALLELGKAASVAQPEQYFAVARDYGLALLLAPDDPVVTQGLQAISDRLMPALSERCEAANGLKISGADLDAARAEAARLLSDLQALKAMESYLNLSESQKSELDEALTTIQQKKARWDKAAAQLKRFDQAFAEALQNPETPCLDDLEQGGGWNFSTARDILTSLRTDAIKVKDKGVQELVDTRLHRLEEYEEHANRVMELVRGLLQALKDEQFDDAVSAADKLEILWKEVTAQAELNGLEQVLCYPYRYPSVTRVCSLREHRQRVLKQKTNFQDWKKYAEEVTRLYDQLMALTQELLDEEFATLKFSLSLRKIQEKCEAWQKECDRFLEKLEQELPKDLPLSRRAETERSAAKSDERKAALSGEGGARARIAELRTAAQEAEIQFKTAYDRLSKFYNSLPPRIKNGHEKPTTAQQERARTLYRECQEHNPTDDNLKRLKSQLEHLGFTLADK